MRDSNFFKIFKGYNEGQLVNLLMFFLLSFLNTYTNSIETVTLLLTRQLLLFLFFFLCAFFTSKIPIKLFHLSSFAFFAIAVPILLLTIFSPLFFTNPKTVELSFFTFDVVPLVSVMMIFFFSERITSVIVKNGNFKNFFISVGLPLLFIYFLLFLIDSTYASSFFLAFLIIILVLFRFEYTVKFLGILLILYGIVFTGIFFTDTPRTNVIKGRIQSIINIDAPQSNNSNESYSFVLTQKVKEGGLFGVGPIAKKEPSKYKSAYLDFLNQYGIIGGVFLLTLYMSFFFINLKNIFRSTSIYTLVLQTSIIVFITIMAFIHILSATGILPFVDIELPLVSTPGQNLLYYSILVGILLNRNNKDFVI